MPRLNPDHLLEQADHLIERRTADGEPRDVDLRRAVSAAYYGVFHYVIAAATDAFIGSAARGTTSHTLVYRSIDHRVLRSLCMEVKKQKLSAKYHLYAPTGFAREVKSFAGSVIELQEKRHSADYDPSATFNVRRTALMLDEARQAIGRFANASADQRRAFLLLLLFPPR